MMFFVFADKKIPLILPVVSVYQLDTDHVTVTNLSMWFTLSVKKEQEPAPTDPEVSITTLPGQQYFVAEYVYAKGHISLCMFCLALGQKMQRYLCW